MGEGGGELGWERKGRRRVRDGCDGGAGLIHVHLMQKINSTGARLAAPPSAVALERHFQEQHVSYTVKI